MKMVFLAIFLFYISGKMRGKFPHIVIFIFLILPSVLHPQNMVVKNFVELNSLQPVIRQPVSLQIHPIGFLLIGDAFQRTVFGYDPTTGSIRTASTASLDRPLSYPSRICVNPLYILVLDSRNQTVYRFDRQLRPVGYLDENLWGSYTGGNLILDLQLDEQNYFYLLVDRQFSILRFSADNRYQFQFGGSRSAELELRDIREFHVAGQNQFVTYDYAQQKLIGFDHTGALLWRLSLPQEVLDISANETGAWMVIYRENGLNYLYGRNSQLLYRGRITGLSDEAIIDLSLPFQEKQSWILTQRFLWYLVIESGTPEQ